MNYTFEASKDINLIALTSNLMNIIMIDQRYNKAATELYGRLLTAFGEPVETSKSLENAYTYVILAKCEDGNKHVLSVYEGPSGPAIGGNKNAMDAAQALKKHILNAMPADYEYKGYYLDGPTKIHRGIKNGEVFYSEVPMDFDDEEYKQAYKEMYG